MSDSRPASRSKTAPSTTCRMGGSETTPTSIATPAARRINQRRTARWAGLQSTSAMPTCWNCPTGAVRNQAMPSTTTNAAIASAGNGERASTLLISNGVLHQSSVLAMSGVENRSRRASATRSAVASATTACTGRSTAAGAPATSTVSISRPRVNAAAPTQAPPKVDTVNTAASSASTAVRAPVARAIGFV